MKRILIAAVLFAVMLLLAQGCARRKADDPDPAAANAEHTIAPEEHPTFIAWRKPLFVDRHARDFNGGYITYPYVKGGAEAQINMSIFSTVKMYVESISQPLYADFDVMTNGDGFLSCRMYLLDFDTYEPVDILTLNYDVETGAPCTLPSNFVSANNQWRRVIPDMLSAQSQSMGITLLSDIMPVEDNRPFYIKDGKIVFVYRLYEIATYNAGAPEFAIPLTDLSNYLAEDAPIRRFMEPLSAEG